MPQQRMLIALAVTVSSTLITLAEEPDRPVETARVRSVIVELNKARRDANAKAFSQLFAPDGNLRVGNEIIATGPDAIEDAMKNPPVWTEMTAPKIENESVRFVSPVVALVDGTQTRFGPLILKESVPVTLLLKLDGQEWRIISLWLDPHTDYPRRRLTRSHFW